MRISNIRQFTQANYSVHVSWKSLDNWACQLDGQIVETNPEFQRGHVWTVQQQIKYVEYRLQGGIGAKELFWNCPGWGSTGKNGVLQLVDGLQRYTAVQKFMNNEIPAFGHKLEEYEDNVDIVRHNFVMTVNNLEKYSDVLQWYVDLNAGGIVHSVQEIDRIRRMIKNAKLSEEKV